MSRGRVITVLSILAIAVAAFAFISLAVDLPPRSNAAVPREIGRALATEAQKLAAGPGEFIVIARETSTFKQPALDIALASFLEVIRKGGGTVSGVRAVELDPLRPVQVPSGDFMDLIHSAPASSVVVSFMGPPLLTDEQRAQLGQIKPKIVAFCSGNLSGSGELRRLFDQGLLHAAVVARYLVETGKPATGTAAASFEGQYVTVTKATMGGQP